ncbi:hypothetical protein MMC08_002361 [Hypocenomyce scalaris]|nr:hypothetical protein [Hypocenomyce scalaris]
MTELSSILQPLSNNFTLHQLFDDSHNKSIQPSSLEPAAQAVIAPYVSLVGSHYTSSSQLSLPSTSRDPEPITIPNKTTDRPTSRMSLASIARDKTTSALSTLVPRSTTTASQSLHSSSSSSLSKDGAATAPTTTQASVNNQEAIHSPKRSQEHRLPLKSRPSAEGNPSETGRPSISGPTDRRRPLDKSPSPSPSSEHNRKPSQKKMHQTSSRLLRMTDEERPFSRDFKDLFSTLMVSLPLTPHRIRFQKIEHTFTSEEAINNLGSLKFSQSNRMPDPKDPSRIVTTTTTTTFSMAKEMARSVCQRFMDARLIESADGKAVPGFPLKGAVWQLTPKGINILNRFCQRNGINQRHVLDVLDSPRNTMQLVILERDGNTDKLSHDKATIEVIFRRFAGQDGPNIKTNTSTSDSDSLSDYYNGLVGVKMARERRVSDSVVQNTFTGRAAADWLMDCCTTIDRRETREIADLFVQHGLILAVVEDKVYKTQSSSFAGFQPTKNAIYGLTIKGQRLAGWITRENSNSVGERESEMSSRASGSTRNDGKATPRDSNNHRLNVIVNDPALRLLFKEYLRDTHCEENLTFYLEVRDFTKSYDQADRAKAFTRLDAIRESLAAAYGLYNAFLAPGSPCELNIDHNLRNSLAGRMTRAVGDDDAMLKSLQEVVALFRNAQTSVYKLMSSDSVPKFLKEPRYAQVLREHNFDHTVVA